MRLLALVLFFSLTGNLFAVEKKDEKKAARKTERRAEKKPQAQSPKMNSDWNRFNAGMSRQEKKDAAKNAPKAKSP